jgi:phage tail sheath protein FI
VTTSNEPSYRLASISRTIGLVLRAARNIGDAYVFETSGARLWHRIAASMRDVLAALQAAGALSGGGSGDAFQVRCDRSTMTQQDIDNGRVIVQVMLIPAGTIETMRIQLTMGKGRQVSLAALGMEAA